MAFREIGQDIQLDQPRGFREVGADIQLDQPEEKGFFGRVGEDIGERASAIGDIFQRRGPESIGYTGERRGVTGAIQDLPGTAALAAGQVAGGIADIGGEALMSGLSAITPEPVKEFAANTLQDLGKTRLGQAALTAFSHGGDVYKRFKENNPDAAQSLEGIVNITGVAMGRKGAKVAAKEAADIASDAGVLAAKAVPRSIDNKLSRLVKSKIDKAIRPSVTGQRTATQSQQYFKKAEDAVKTIIENKNNLNLTDEFGDVIEGLPQNLRHFSEAIDTTKKKLFTEFDDLAVQAGKKGVAVPLRNISKELDDVILNRGVTQDIRDYALKVKTELQDLGSFTPSEAQTRIQALNRKLNSVADFNSAAPAYVDALVANNLRKNLDNVVTGATGKEFQILKNKYGALKTIEKDVARRAAVDARKNVKGLLDFTDIFTGSQVIRGVTTGGATGGADVAAGVVGRFMKERFSKLNDPNRIVKDMFSDAEKLVVKSKAIKAPFSPRSATIGAIQGIGE